MNRLSSGLEGSFSWIPLQDFAGGESAFDTRPPTPLSPTVPCMLGCWTLPCSKVSGLGFIDFTAQGFGFGV